MVLSWSWSIGVAKEVWISVFSECRFALPAGWAGIRALRVSLLNEQQSQKDEE